MFQRSAKRLLKRSPDVTDRFHKALQLLQADLNHPQLRTHKLKGTLTGSLACSVSSDIRIIFRVVADDGEDKILLQTIGTHDEVY